jgi:hypothetical protein
LAYFIRRAPNDVERFARNNVFERVVGFLLRYLSIRGKPFDVSQNGKISSYEISIVVRSAFVCSSTMYDNELTTTKNQTRDLYIACLDQGPDNNCEH